jgi:purine-binding chemotaxis protein CheW
MEATKQVVFKLGQEEYGLDILIVNAIETYRGVVPVPNAPDYILGMLNLRGEVIPVFSLRIKFGLPEETLEHEQLIITRTKDMVVGYKVDAVCGIVEFLSKEISEVPVIVRSDKTKYAKYVANKDSKMILLLDHEGILDAKEKGSIQEVLTNQE